MSMTGTIVETDDDRQIVDEYGNAWTIIADDGCGHYAIERDAGERWEAGEFNAGHAGLYMSQEGSTFGVSCQDEYRAERVDNAGSLRWVDQTDDA